MGFYGNITNVSRNSFQFDRTYPNRKMMEDNTTTDGIYIGRYVLVDYDATITNKDYKYAYKAQASNNTYLYTDVNCSASNVIQLTDNILIKEDSVAYGVTLGTYVMVDVATFNDSTKSGGPYEFYRCKGSDSTGAIFELVTSSTSLSQLTTPYAFNYKVDEEWIKTYNEQEDVADIAFGRGWDSTVWQKVYANGIEKYVMLAELNSVVPTFDISADAPSMAPITPHFDERSTDTYYKLHWQPQWGLRVKSSNASLTGAVLDSAGEDSQINTSDGVVSTTLMSTSGLNYPSDNNTLWDRYDYDTNDDSESYHVYEVDDTGAGSWVDYTNSSDEIENSVPAAIYWNNSGFKADEIHRSEYLTDSTKTTRYNSKLAKWGTNKITDNITITPTGQSGHTYNLHTDDTGYGTEGIRPDIQELSIMLPSIGDSISKMWDIVYGGPDTNDEIKASLERNLDINWEDAASDPEREGLRLINGTEVDGLYLNKGEVDTLAGCINSVHDLMGMIIVEKETAADANLDAVDATEFDSNKIYYYPQDGSFRRRKEDYSYNEISYTYVEITNTDELEYTPNVYYYKTSSDGDYIKDTDNTEFNSSYTYYYKKSNTASNQEYQEIDLIDFVTDSYYKDADGSYEHNSNKIAQDGIIYYTKQSDIADAKAYVFEYNYEPDKYYYLDGNDYILDTADHITYGRQYYVLDTSDDTDQIQCITQELTEELIDSYDFDTEKYGDLSTDDTDTYPTYFYSPQSFYFFNDEGKWERDDNETPTAGREYYIGNRYTVGTATTVINGYRVNIKQLPSNNSVYYYNTVSQDLYLVTLEMLTDWQKSFGFHDNNLDTEPMHYSTGVDFYVFIEGEEPEAIDGIYEPNRYFYINGEAIKMSTTPELVEDRTYYMTHDLEDGEDPDDWSDYILFEKIVAPFYVPNKYYYLNGTQYVLSKDTTAAEGRTYYTLNHFYVLEDLAGVYPAFSVWNSNVEVIPCTVRLATRVTKYIVAELDGFARTLNTIHGLILKTNRLLEYGDYKTRDRNSVQGAINTLNDIINSFGQLKTKEFVITDDYGRIKSSPWTSEQALTYANIGKPSADGSQAAAENKWIYIDINSNPVESEVIFKHMFNEVDDTETTSNKNNDSGSVLDGLNKEHGDTLNLYTPIVDSTGHVVGKNTETVTLPFGFKNLKVANSSDDENQWSQSGEATKSQDENVTDIIADNTQDTLTLNAGNKWMRLKTDSSTDTLTLAHETHDFDTVEVTETNLNAETGAVNESNINIPDWTYDIAGHITGKKDHKYTLPYGYKTFQDSETSQGKSVANTTQDTFTFKGDTWVKPVVTNDLVTFTHLDPNSVAERTIENKTPLFGETFTIEDWRFDNKGHKYGLQTHTVQIPQGKLTDGGVTTGATSAITSIAFTPSTGEITTKQEYISTMTLGSYEQPTVASTTLVAQGDTIRTAFKKLDAHIINIENTINALDYDQSSQITSSNVVSDVTETNGLISVARKNVGTLTLAEYEKSDDTNTNYTGPVVKTDTINNAFAKVSNDVATLKGSDAGKSVRTIANEELVAQLIPSDAQEALDTLKEIADWIQDHPDEAAAMNSAISALEGRMDTAESDIDSLEDRATALEALELPSHEDMTNDSVYMIKKTADGLAWVELSSWTGGSY